MLGTERETIAADQVDADEDGYLAGQAAERRTGRKGGGERKKGKKLEHHAESHHEAAKADL